MCIRDRSGCVTKEVLIDGRNANTKKFGERTIKFDMVLHACLLYTSDAADERSSVDLGGRRIIKKKKQLTIDEYMTPHITNTA